MEGILQVVTSIRTPLALTALVFLGVFLLLREVIKGKVFPKLSERNWVALLKQGMLLLFILLIILVMLGFAGYFLGSDEPDSNPRKSSSEHSSGASPITRSETACRWVWIYLGRFSDLQDRYEVPEAFEYAGSSSLRSPIPRSGDSILVVSQRSQIVTGYKDAAPDEKCARMLDAPATYRPEVAYSFEAGIIPAGKVVTVNKIELLPSPEAEPKYVWALVGAPR